VGASDARRTVDEATLRYLKQVLAGQREVEETSLFPQNKQESLVVHLDSDSYPDDISARLEIRLYTDGEFHVSYLEDNLGELRRCRWDRHEQDHSARDHFHPLPVASTTEAEDRAFPDEMTALLSGGVLPWVEDRLDALWDG
jgi:hypothetical protein